MNSLMFLQWSYAVVRSLKRDLNHANSLIVKYNDLIIVYKKEQKNLIFIDRAFYVFRFTHSNSFVKTL